MSFTDNPAHRSATGNALRGHREFPALARLLKAPLAAREHIDLMAAAVTPAVARGRQRQRGRIDPSLALLAGLGAGVTATAVQLVLWWLAAMPVLETLLRDARLTAAMVLGSSVLAPPSTAPWTILVVATLIHFALSFVYALIPTHFAGRLRAAPALLAGALYGLGIYVVNMYGFTWLFPWFGMVRDWVTLLTHLVFGVMLVVGCRLFAANPGRSGTAAR